MKSRDAIELIAGIGTGAAIMYLLDPKMGKKRRRRLKTQAGHALEETGEYLGDAWHNLADRASHLGHDIKAYYGQYADDASERAGRAGQALLDYGRAYAHNSGAYGRKLSKRARRRGEELQHHAQSYYQAAQKRGAAALPHLGPGFFTRLGRQVSDFGHYLSSTAHELVHKARPEKHAAAGILSYLAPSGYHRGGYLSRRRAGQSYLPTLRRRPQAEEHAAPASLVGTAVAFAVLGAGIMFIFDPDRGRRRRALARDKMIRAAHATSDFARDTGQYLADKTRGAAHEARARVYEGHVDDHTLTERVRAELGRAVSHPGSIHVTAEAGCVTLTGPCLRSEVDELLARVESVRGVKSVENRLEIHETPGNVPGLQGIASRS